MSEHGVTVQEFERQVYVYESVRVIVRASRAARVDVYHFDNRAAYNTTVGDFVRNRVAPKVRGYEVEVIDGNGNVDTLDLTLEETRASYD